MCIRDRFSHSAPSVSDPACRLSGIKSLAVVASPTPPARRAACWQAANFSRQPNHQKRGPGNRTEALGACEAPWASLRAFCPRGCSLGGVLRLFPAPLPFAFPLSAHIWHQGPPRSAAGKSYAAVLGRLPRVSPVDVTGGGCGLVRYGLPMCQQGSIPMVWGGLAPAGVKRPPPGPP